MRPTLRAQRRGEVGVREGIGEGRNARLRLQASPVTSRPLPAKAGAAAAAREDALGAPAGRLGGCKVRERTRGGAAAAAQAGPGSHHLGDAEGTGHGSRSADTRTPPSRPAPGAALTIAPALARGRRGRPELPGLGRRG